MMAGFGEKMVIHQIIALATPTAARSVRLWIYRLGGVGFIPLGILDNSIIPLPGSMDLLTIFLSSRTGAIWPYYALMATIGSLIGGYVTYRLARKGGKEALKRRFPSRTLDKVYKSFDRWGFGAIAIPAMLPPPVPITPSLLAAGALQYPAKKFMLALALGRTVRYTLLAFLAARYGRRIMSSIVRFGHPVPIAIIAATIIAGLILMYYVQGKRQTPA
jgi:membrane protein YqaA with SNARE-associated domain